MIACWRINYGLDKRSPADAARYWEERCAGMAPAGAVAALGLVLIELEALLAQAEPVAWPQMIAALAAIDAALGLPEDSCNSLAQTLAAIKKLKTTRRSRLRCRG